MKDMWKDHQVDDHLQEVNDESRYMNLLEELREKSQNEVYDEEQMRNEIQAILAENNFKSQKDVMDYVESILHREQSDEDMMSKANNRLLGPLFAILATSGLYIAGETFNYYNNPNADFRNNPPSAIVQTYTEQPKTEQERMIDRIIDSAFERSQTGESLEGNIEIPIQIRAFRENENEGPYKPADTYGELSERIHDHIGAYSDLKDELENDRKRKDLMDALNQEKLIPGQYPPDDPQNPEYESLLNEIPLTGGGDGSSGEGFDEVSAELGNEKILDNGSNTTITDALSEIKDLASDLTGKDDHETELLEGNQDILTDNTSDDDQDNSLLDNLYEDESVLEESSYEEESIVEESLVEEPVYEEPVVEETYVEAAPSDDGGDMSKYHEYDDDNDSFYTTAMEFSQAEWEDKTTDEKMELIVDMKSEIETDLGLEIPPRIEFYESNDPGDYASASMDGSLIRINTRNIKDGEETLDTIAHELRHVYQQQRAMLLENDEDRRFLEGFQDYITPDIDPVGYQNQFVEVDARDYAAQIRSILHKEVGE